MTTDPAPVHRRRPRHRRPLSRADELQLARVLEAPFYDDAEVHHGAPWAPSLGGPGAASFTAATQRTLAFLTAWGVQQLKVGALETEVAEQRVRGDVGEALARSLRTAQRLTHEVLGKDDAPTVTLRVAKDR